MKKIISIMIWAGVGLCSHAFGSITERFNDTKRLLAKSGERFGGRIKGYKDSIASSGSTEASEASDDRPTHGSGVPVPAVTDRKDRIGLLCKVGGETRGVKTIGECESNGGVWALAVYLGALPGDEWYTGDKKDQKIGGYAMEAGTFSYFPTADYVYSACDVIKNKENNAIFKLNPGILTDNMTLFKNGISNLKSRYGLGDAATPGATITAKTKEGRDFQKALTVRDVVTARVCSLAKELTDNEKPVEDFVLIGKAPVGWKGRKD